MSQKTKEINVASDHVVLVPWWEKIPNLKVVPYQVDLIEEVSPTHWQSITILRTIIMTNVFMFQKEKKKWRFWGCFFFGVAKTAYVVRPLWLSKKT